MSVFSFYFLLCIAVSAIYPRSCAGEESNVPIVRVKQGLIKGIKEKALKGKPFYSYMNIPYAEPPIENLRFKDPVPVKSWEGVLDGSKMPGYCLQTGMFDGMEAPKTKTTILGSENCLYLNVYTNVPNQPDKKLAVMVFIHGGGFVYGGAQEYLPHVLMDRVNKDIILVVIQYRLGIFGFLSTEDSMMPGNMGLKDQQLALKWIKENIETFGGDPDTITIFGESSGAVAVHYQILSPGSKGLFKRAIMQSGSALNPFASNINHRKFAIETGRQFNCSIDYGTEVYLECMQKVNALYLTVAASDTLVMGITPFYVLPRVDGEFITDAPEILMKEGKYNKVDDVIAGITRDEGAFLSFMYSMDPSINKSINEDFAKYGPLSLGLQDEENSEGLARKIYQQYLEREDTFVRDTDKRKIIKMYSDIFFREPHDTTANLFLKNGVDLYLYQLDHVGETSFAPSSNLVSHGDDLAYLFEGGPFFPKPMKKEEDLALRKFMILFWTYFAQTGNPNIEPADFRWEKATSKSFRYFSITLEPHMEDDKLRLKRNFWSTLKTRRNLNLQNVTTKLDLESKEEL